MSVFTGVMVSIALVFDVLVAASPEGGKQREVCAVIGGLATLILMGLVGYWVAVALGRL